ncbi:MAG TPA: cyanophycinase [Phycisphaerales bacterium]|nr:cyanophycinase [Phycisphaerales bacterium]
MFSALALGGADPSAAHAQGYVCAEGGGSIGRGEWSSPVFRWMVQSARDGRARAGGPDPHRPIAVAIIGSFDGVREPDAPEPNDPEDRLIQRFRAAGAGTVADLWINDANAADPEIARAIAGSDIVWLRGGSQTRYVQYFKGTPTEAAILEVFRRGGVVGGTSAGCAVLGIVDYDARNGSCAPLDALRDAQTPKITLDVGFLDLVPGMMFDTHFTERGRLARFLVMLARAQRELGHDLVGIGMDTRTALCVDPDGTAVVLGQGAAVVVAPRRGGPAPHLPHEAPPHGINAEVSHLLAGDRIDLTTWRITRAQTSDFMRPETEPDRPANLAGPVRGHELADSGAGDVVVDPEADPRALFTGGLGLLPGRGLLPGWIIQTRAFDDARHTENRLGGLLWALATSSPRVGLALAGGTVVLVDDTGTARVEPGPDAPASVLWFGAGKLTDIRRGVEFTSPSDAAPRQAVAFTGMLVRVVAPGQAIAGRPGPPGPEAPPGRAAPGK